MKIISFRFLNTKENRICNKSARNLNIVLFLVACRMWKYFLIQSIHPQCFEKNYTTGCKGEGCMIRYADDCVWAFEYQEDAERFYEALKVRLKKFKLELSGEKSNIIKFDRYKPESRFCFLGFEFYWSRDRKGSPHIKKRTSRNKLRQSIRNVND